MFPRVDPRIRKARRLRALASGSSQAGDEARARWLRRRALACLDPEGEDSAWTAEPDLRELAEQLRAVQISRALDQRLRRYSVWGWVAARWRRLSVVAGGVVLGLAVLVVAVAPLRRAVFPPDLATGKRWWASSTISGWPAGGTLHGDAGDACCLFHTNEEASPSFTIDLGKITPVHLVEISNRADCCADRALPLAVELSVDGRKWTRVGYRRGEFGQWNAQFPKQGAHFVRLRVDRTSILHLPRVAVY